MKVTIKELYEAGADFNVTLNYRGTDFIDVYQEGLAFTTRYNLDALQEFFKMHDWDMSRIKTEVL